MRKKREKSEGQILETSYNENNHSTLSGEFKKCFDFQFL